MTSGAPRLRPGRRTSGACSPWRTAIAGPTIITVQAEGFAPQIRDVRVEERTAPVDIRLTEPASSRPGQGRRRRGQAGRRCVLRRRHLARASVDPVPGLRPTRMAGLSGAARPGTSCSTTSASEGYMASRQVPLTASDQEQVITFHPELIDHRPRDRRRDRTPGAQVPRGPRPPV